MELLIRCLAISHFVRWRILVAPLSGRIFIGSVSKLLFQASWPVLFHYVVERQ
jgi:hypothetical protein